MANTWRVLLNPKYWNQVKYERDFATRPEVHYLSQSKGGRRMISCPQKGDIVLFVIKGKIRMRGIMESNGFETGTCHQEHSCNTGTIRPHEFVEEYARVKIIEVGLSDDIDFFGQHTWHKL